MITLEIIEEIKDLAEKRNDARENKDQITSLSDVDFGSFRDLPEQKALYDYLNNLSYEDLLAVESYMIYGRGDTDTLEEARSYIISEFSGYEDKETTIGYIMEKMPLHKYLEAALRH